MVTSLDNNDWFKVSINKFDGKNYHFWKLRMSALLKARGLWKYVIEDVTAAAENEDGEPVEISEDVQLKQDQAFCTIVMGLCDSQLGYILNETSAFAAWAKLQNVHEAPLRQNKSFLRYKFFRTKMSKGESVQNHISKIMGMAAKLEAIGSPVSQDDLYLTILCGLPPEYDTLIQTLDSCTDNLDLNVLTGRLLKQEATLLARNTF